MKLAEALLLRKQLEAKVKQLEPIKLQGDQGLFEIKTKRVNVGENTDEITFQIPKVELNDVTGEYDRYATALRKLDASIQEANWAHSVTFKDTENPFNGEKKKKK